MWDSLVSTWSWTTAVITALVLPVIAALALTLRTAIVKWSRYALDGCLYFIGRHITHQVATALTLRRYATLLLSGPSRFLLVPAREDVSLETDTVFIPLTLEAPTGDRHYDHANITECGPRIRIIGEPGSGKTTVLKRILRDECQRCLKRSNSARLPIFYELKRLRPATDIDPEALGDWLLDQIKLDLLKTHVYKMDECIKSYLSNKGALLLLDGADEINTSLYPTIQTAILALSDRLNQLSENNIIIMTMRSQFYQQTRSALSVRYPVVVEAKPFSPRDIYRFLSLWPFKRDAQRHAARIYADLLDRPTLREMCSNPLVLSMYVAEDQLTGHPLVPETRTDFYARITQELLIRRRAAQPGQPAAMYKIREDRERFFGSISVRAPS
jgi:hypothetical protein